MKVLFWLFIGLDRQETSEHLLVSVIEQLCRSGHEVYIIQKYTGGDLPSIPSRLSGYPVTTTTIQQKGTLLHDIIKNSFIFQSARNTSNKVMMLYLFNLIQLQVLQLRQYLRNFLKLRSLSMFRIFFLTI